jgi:Protein of unknown function (DUF2848)
MLVTLYKGQTTEKKELSIKKAIVAGWTGRDKAALEKHIKELEELGVPRPASTPIYYRVSASRITAQRTIETTGAESSGEVEFVLAQMNGELWVGVGSDHTDRKVETYNVTVSKQMCEKPIAPEFWAFADVAPHWDKLVMRAFIEENGARVLYQEGSVTAMQDPLALIKGYEGKASLEDGALMFCGTFAAKGGIRPADLFEYELHDPVLNRTIQHAYRLEKLPVLG